MSEQGPWSHVTGEHKNLHLTPSDPLDLDALEKYCANHKKNVQEGMPRSASTEIIDRLVAELRALRKEVEERGGRIELLVGVMQRRDMELADLRKERDELEGALELQRDAIGAAIDCTNKSEDDLADLRAAHERLRTLARAVLEKATTGIWSGPYDPEAALHEALLEAKP